MILFDFGLELLEKVLGPVGIARPARVAGLARSAADKNVVSERSHRTDTPCRSPFDFHKVAITLGVTSFSSTKRRAHATTAKPAGERIAASLDANRVMNFANPKREPPILVRTPHEAKRSTNPLIIRQCANPIMYPPCECSD